LIEIDKIYNGEAYETLKTFPDKVFQCCISSPPFFGLRDYKTGKWEGGDSECSHIVGNQVQDNKAKGAITAGVRPGCDASTCKICGAKRVDKQIGLESTPEEYVKNLVKICREVKRTLRDDGLFWLNLGDSYAGSWGNSGHRPELDGTPSHQREKDCDYLPRGGWDDRRERPASSYKMPNIKPKDLIGIPWMVAFALRDDGWWLRSDIIWAKGVSGQKELASQIITAAHEVGIEDNKVEELLASLNLYVGNPMPESTKDRCTRSHEYLFMFAKSKKYFYDNEAIKEEAVNPKDKRRPLGSNGAWEMDGRIQRENGGGQPYDHDTSVRNRRDVWTIVTKPYTGAHFATFPPELIIPPILASTSEKGCCSGCGAPYKRIVDRKPMVIRKTDRMSEMGEFGRTQSSGTMLSPAESKTLGWEPTCACETGSIVPCLILDPFMGSGTTGLVARKLGRNYIGIDLNKSYCEMANERITNSI